MPTEIIVALISTCGGALVGAIIQAIKNRKDETKKIERAMKILLRKELREQYTHWESIGYITQDGLQEFNDTIVVYEDLCGENGYVDDLAARIKVLRVRSV